MNQLQLSGYLGRDPETSNFGDNEQKVLLNVAWSKYVGKGQESKTIWFRVIVFGDYNVKVAQSAKKGDRVVVVGQVETREYTTNDGTTKVITEVIVNKYGGEVFIIPKQAGTYSHTEGNSEYQAQPKPATPKPSQALNMPSFNDDMPF